MTIRIALRGGWVADGIGATIRRADVLIEGERIAAVRDAPVEGAAPAAAHHDHLLKGSATDAPGQPAEVIDLPPGSVVCPGFIDAHAHAEGPLLEHGRVDGALAQGVTTLVVGQDGQSWIGADAATLRYLNRYFGPVNGTLAAPAAGPRFGPASPPRCCCWSTAPPCGGKPSASRSGRCATWRWERSAWPWSGSPSGRWWAAWPG